MNKAYTDIDQEIRDQLADYKGWPPGTDRTAGAHWNRLEALLDESEEKKQPLWAWMSAAAVVVLVITFGIIRWNLATHPDTRIVFTSAEGATVLAQESGELIVEEADPRNEGLIYQVPREPQAAEDPPKPEIQVDADQEDPPVTEEEGEIEIGLNDNWAGKLELMKVTTQESKEVSTIIETSPDANYTYSWDFASSGKRDKGTGTATRGTYTVTHDLNGYLANTGSAGGEQGRFQAQSYKPTQQFEGKWKDKERKDDTKSLDPVDQGGLLGDSILIFDEWDWADYPLIMENPFTRPFDEALSTFSIDVDHASYSNMRRYITDGTLPPPDAIRIEELVNYFDYDYTPPPAEGKVPFNLVSELSDCPWAAGHKLVHLGIQGKKIATEDLPPSNLVFLIDVSGSMNSFNKLPLLKESFKLLVQEMRPQDKVSMVVYAGAAGVVLKPTSGDKKSRILHALEELEAGGSTAGGEGIELAYKLARENFLEDGNNRVILATDGDFNVGPSSDKELEKLIERRRKDGVFLSILGFGTGNYQDGKMQMLADKGNGNHYYIDNLKEAQKTLVNEFGGTLYTIAKDVKIQVEFNPALVESYRLIGYENRMLEAEDFDNDAIDAGELGAGHTVTALYEIVPANAGVSQNEAGRLTDAAKNSKEWLTLKLRYKEPDGETSKLIRKPLREAHLPLTSTSDSYRWSAAVAGFGLLLRNSQYKGTADYKMIIQLAEGAIGDDPEGYRAEFIQLVKSAQVLDNVQAIEKQYQDIWGN